MTFEPAPDDAYASAAFGQPATKADIVAAVAAVRRDMYRLFRDLLLAQIAVLCAAIIVIYLLRH